MQENFLILELLWYLSGEEISLPQLTVQLQCWVRNQGGGGGWEGLHRFLCCLTWSDVTELHNLRMLLILDSEVPKVESNASKSGKSVESRRGMIGVGQVA